MDTFSIGCGNSVECMIQYIVAAYITDYRNYRNVITRDPY